MRAEFMLAEFMRDVERLGYGERTVNNPMPAGKSRNCPSHSSATAKTPDRIDDA